MGNIEGVQGNTNGLHGDRDPLGRLAVRFRPRLEAYFRGHGARNDDAEDLAQETLTRWIAAYRGGRLRSADSERWLFRTARYVRFESIRRHRTEPLDVEPVARPWHHRESERVFEAVRAEVAQLRPELREALRLRLEDDLSYQDIGLRLGISESAVTMRLYRARRELERRLARFLDD